MGLPPRSPTSGGARRSDTSAINEAEITSASSLGPAARIAMPMPFASGLPNNGASLDTASSVTFALTAWSARSATRAASVAVSAARRRRRTSSASLSATRSPARSAILWTLDTSSAAGPASIATDRSTPSVSDVIVVSSRSTSVPSRPLARLATLLPWGPRRAPLEPAPASASGTMRSTRIPSRLRQSPGCSSSENPHGISKSARSGVSFRSAGATQKSASVVCGAVATKSASPVWT